MNLHVKFIIIADGETDSVLERYIGRIPEPGEFVSFPDPSDPAHTVWIPFEVIRIHTYIARNEPHYNVEIKKC